MFANVPQICSFEAHPPVVSKLWARINEDVPSGQTLNISITNRYGWPAHILNDKPSKSCKYVSNVQDYFGATCQTLDLQKDPERFKCVFCNRSGPAESSFPK